MKLSDIIEYSAKPPVYEKGTAEMWTDEYISKQLLDVHLSNETDLASRKKSTIVSTVNWILAHAENKKLKILDLGCGPGLYAELLAEKGHKVTGVDFSANSIDYAQKSAKEKNLKIKYIHENYLKFEMAKETFDFVIFIYADLGVLHPDDQKKMLSSIYKALKPGGILIFDVLNDKKLEKKITPKSWEVCKKGFWRPNSYLVLSESFFYEQEKVILYQHLVYDEENGLETYRFWTHFYSDEDLSELLSEQSFRRFRFYKNVLPEGELFSGNKVTFCKVIK